MLSISIANVIKYKILRECGNKSLLEGARKQIRWLSNEDPKQKSNIDPLHYKVETYQGTFEDRKGKRKTKYWIRVEMIH